MNVIPPPPPVQAPINVGQNNLKCNFIYDQGKIDCIFAQIIG